MPLLVEGSNGSPNASDLIEQREKLRSDYRWISEEQMSLQKKYLNKFVAVRNKQVIVAAENVYSLMEKLKTKGLRTDSVAVEFVSEQPLCFLL